jgi:ferric-dicitrate binding protein FerR (iron transport regulator)
LKESPNIRRLEDLFPRYWDSALTSPELAELEQILTSDPEARHSFLMLSMQVVAPVELSAIATHLPAPPPPSPVGWSRRRLLRLAGGGVALGLGGLASALGWRWFRGDAGSPVRLESVRGLVRLGSTQASAGMHLPLGAVLRSVGPSSSAVLALPGGTTVSITGDSTLGVEELGRRLKLHEGTATADVRPPADEEPLVLATPAASLISAGGAAVTLGSDAAGTEVGVQTGQVRVSDRAGAVVGDVREGEILTVRAGGKSRKQTLQPTPTSFRWDLARPLPEGWAVGHLEATDAGPAVAPEFWYDPYHSAVLSQIRSDNQWTRGLVMLYPDSLIRVRYRVDRPGRGQLVICVRTPRRDRHASGVVEVNDAFVNSRPGEWQWLEARPRDMLNVKEAPAFGPPWVGFLVIFNTYEVDLGLRVADLRVSRNGGDPNG